MGFLDFFKRTKSAEEIFRMNIRDAFKQCVADTKPHMIGDKMMDGLLVQAAIGSTYQSLKNASEMQVVGLMAQGWMPETIIEEELQRVLKKYLGIESKASSFDSCEDFSTAPTQDVKVECEAIKEDIIEEFEISSDGKILKTFKGRNRDIIIPEGIEVIEEKAFCGSNICSVSLPQSLKRIEDNAFCSCASLAELDLSSCNDLEHIGEWAFSWCLNLKGQFTLPISLKSMADNPFAHTSISKIISLSPYFLIKDGCLVEKTNGRLIFGFFVNEKSDKYMEFGGIRTYLSRDFSEYTIPNDIDILGNSAFLGADNLKCLIIPESIKSIEGNPAPNGSSTKIVSHNLTFPVINDMLIDKSNGILLAYFGEGASVRIPDGIKSVDGSAFDHADIEELTLPTSLSGIDDDIVERMDSNPIIKKLSDF